MGEKQLKAVSTAPSRNVNLFEIPETLAEETGVTEIGIVTLNSDEELACFKRSKGDNAKLATELAKQALVEANGKPLTGADGSVDSFWKTLDPRLRQLVLTAYTELHGATEEDTQSFLKSRKQRA